MSERTDFFIVGIGASAGGLEALQTFLSNLPHSSPAAFVIIQHLSPDFKSMMDKILAKHTEMRVTKVTRNTKVKPNHIYLMSPKKNLELMGDTLTPRDHRPEDKPNLPIDMFFTSLGKHWGANTVGIILSGTGTDGSRGIKTIKEQGGIIMVQVPESAKFDGMPNATLLTGLADFVLKLPELAQEVERIVHFIPQISSEVKKLPSSEKDYLNEILLLVANETRINFALYKEATILRRMQKRMHITHVDTLKNYHEILTDNAAEIKQLSNEFLIGVSSFFRDKYPWDVFRDKVLPEIIAQKESGDTIRIWVAGCATGEEAYTIGMLIDDYLAKHELNLSYKIFGSDVDQRSIYTAGMGVYNSAMTDAIPPEFLTSYFDKKGITYKVKKSFRDCFVFAAQNIISDPPFIKMDVVACRNVLIYLNNDVQQKVLSNFHFSLNSGGYLILGKSENIGSLGVFFTPIGDKTNIFQNRVPFNRKLHQDFLPKISIETPPHKNILPESTRTLNPAFFNSLITKAYDEDGVVVNSNYQILHIKGNLDRHFFFPKNDLSLYLEDVLDKDEYWLLKGGIQEALRHTKAIYYDDVIFKKGRKVSMLDLRFKAVNTDPQTLKLVYIEFRNERDHHADKPLIMPFSSEDQEQRLALLDKELDEKQRNIQLLREELETSSEELQTSNEELLASNEELQSSNEELQSVNEEIYSVNSELQEKIKEVTHINNDLVNVLNSTEIATIFVDHDFKIRRLTPKASEIVNITQKDIGRSIDHFTTNLADLSLMPLAKQVVDTTRPLEREVSLKTGACYYLMKILPYRKADGSIEGLVITFVDITEVKEAQINVQNARTFAENIVRSVADPLIVLDADLRVFSANPAFYSIFKTSPRNTENQFIYDLGNGQWNEPQLRNLLENVIPENAIVTDYRIERNFKNIGFRVILLNAVTIPQTGDIPNLILLTLRDITEKEQARKQMIETAKRMSLIIQTSKIGTWEYNIQTQKVIADRRLRDLFEIYEEDELTLEGFAHRIHKEDYERVYNALSEAINQNKTYSSDFRIETDSGEIRYLIGHGSMLTTEEGTPYKMLGINMDITERRRAEENITHYGRLLEASYN
ncbi:MAG: chemotaxis protein CheB, partial [Cyclobacteriaceae bacterium]